ncbi:MAG: hypothetical protein AAF750_18510, partial [Planctomycetota bacterium]
MDQALKHVWPLPDHRHLWVLAAGLVLGVLAGPMVLGTVNAGWYERAFVSGGEGAGAAALLEVASGELVAFEAETAGLKERAGAVFQDPEDSSLKAEIEGLELRRSGQRAELAGRVQEAQLRLVAARGVHLDRVRGVLLALVLAGVGVMILEGAVSPAPAPGSGAPHVEVGPGVGRLVTVRYAMGALGLGLVVAQPALLAGVSWVLVGGVLGVGLAAG